MKRKPKKPKKPRKPQMLKATPEDVGSFLVGFKLIASPYKLGNLKPRQARKLAAWLIRSADYLESL